MLPLTENKNKKMEKRSKSLVWLDQAFHEGGTHLADVQILIW